MSAFRAIAVAAALLAGAAGIPSRAGAADLTRALFATPAPARDWEQQARERNTGLPDGERDWFEGDPPAGAPADVLGGWLWERKYDLDAWPPAIVTPAVRQRFFDETRADPTLLPYTFEHFPATDAALQFLHEQLRGLAADKSTYGLPYELREWLVRRSPLFRLELVDLARGGDEAALEALALRDPVAAGPLLRRMLSDPDACTQARACALLYRQMARRPGPGDEPDQLRAQLQRIVQDVRSPAPACEVALAALMSDDWPARDDWFLRLLSEPDVDRLMEEGSLGATALSQVVRAEPERWIPRLARLVGSAERSTHNHAVLCLSYYTGAYARADALRLLLPWLADPEWADERRVHERADILRSLATLNVPECIPGLTAIVERNCAAEVSSAAQALAVYDIPGAAGALKQALTFAPTPRARIELLEVLVPLRTYSPLELAQAVEAYARAPEPHGGRDEPPLVLESTIGEFLCRNWSVSPTLFLSGQPDLPVDGAVAELLVRRCHELHATDPGAAARIWCAVLNWDAPAIRCEQVRRLLAGRADAPLVEALLKKRASLQAEPPIELRSFNGAGELAGIVAALRGEPEEQRLILEGSDRAAQLALVACARLARAPLPLDIMAGWLRAGDDELSAASAEYLYAEDSPAARELLWDRYPDEMLILGSSICSFGSLWDEREGSGEWERALCARMMAPNGPDEVYAYRVDGFGRATKSIELRVRGNDVECWRDENGTQSFAGIVPGEEWRSLRAFLTAADVDNLAPLPNYEILDGGWCEYLHLTRRGGVRVEMHCPQFPAGTVYDRLRRRFLHFAEIMNPP